MSTKLPKPTQQEVQAGEWATRLNQRLVSIDTHNEFETWLKSDPKHALAYERGKKVLQAANSCGDLLEEAKAEETAATERRKQFKSIAAAASVALALGGLFFGARDFSWFGVGANYETATAQVKDIRLSDGTLLTLSAASRIEIDFGRHERRVKLTRGEAFFEVARDTSRPFTVTAGDTLVRVLGTKFDVHYGEQAVQVGVVEGRVEVLHSIDHTTKSAKAYRAPRQLLTAGNTAVATKFGAITISAQANHEDLGAWRQGRLVYVDARVKDIVSDMNRYFDGEIQLVDERLGEQQLTITFRADEIDQGIGLIEAALRVRAVHTATGKVLLTER